MSRLFRVILNDLEFRVFIEVNDFLFVYANEGLRGKIVFVADDVAHEAIIQFDAGA